VEGFKNILKLHMCFVYMYVINMLELDVKLKYCLEQEHCHTIIYFAELELF